MAQNRHLQLFWVGPGKNIHDPWQKIFKASTPTNPWNKKNMYMIFLEYHPKLIPHPPQSAITIITFDWMKSES